MVEIVKFILSVIGGATICYGIAWLIAEIHWWYEHKKKNVLF